MNYEIQYIKVVSKYLDVNNIFDYNNSLFMYLYYL